MNKALYRKYRPLKLEDVVGQKQVTTPLVNALKQGRIGHAYLFIGPRGTGKTSVARIFAHEVNGFKYELEDNRLDIIEIDAASNTGVDNIRELREKAIIAPSEGKYKVYIIDEVHMLSKAAANALLKTLEEPPEHVIFIMATTEAEKIPITISSRTQIHKFRLAEPAVMVAHLRKIADAEKIKINDDALELIVRRGGGSFRDSLSLLDQIATLTTEKITLGLLTEALGLPPREKVAGLLEGYAACDSARLQNGLKELLNEGLSAENIASELIGLVMEAPTAENLELLGRLPEVSEPFAEAKLLLALMDGAVKRGSAMRMGSVATGVGAGGATSVAERPVETSRAPEVAASSTVKKVMEKAASKVQEVMEKPVLEESVPEPLVEEMAKETVPTQEKVVAMTATTVSTVKATNVAEFDWNKLIVTIQETSLTTATQLKKCSYALENQILHIYPANKISLGVLKKQSHAELLRECLGGIEFEVHELGEQPKDAQLEELSGTLGDVRDFEGEVPF